MTRTRFSITIMLRWYGYPHHKMVVGPSYLYNRNAYAGMKTSLYWDNKTRTSDEWKDRRMADCHMNKMNEKHFIGSTEHCCIAQNLIKEKNTAKTAWSIARCRTTTWNIPRCRTTTWNILRCFTGTTTWDIPRCRKTTWNIPRCRTTTWNILRCFTGTTTWDIPRCRATTWNIPRCRRTNWDISRCFTGTTTRNIPKCRTAT